MKIIFMATPDFALQSLAALNVNFNIALVITQPDKPIGRKKEIIFSPVKRFCIESGLDFIQPDKIRNNQELLQLVTQINPDIVCVAAYGKILSQEFLDIPKICCVNIHASLLPKYRGAAPINRAIINGDVETGISLMKMDSGMDTGDIISSFKLQIDDIDTTSTLTTKLADLGANEIVRLMKSIQSDSEILSCKQDNNKATIAPKMSKDDGLIDWGKSFKEIDSLIRGCDPWPIAFTHFNSKMVKIYKIKEHDSDRINPGEIKRIDKSMIVGCKDKNIEIIKIQKSGQRQLTGKDFINGISKIKNPRFT